MPDLENEGFSAVRFGWQKYNSNKHSGTGGILLRSVPRLGESDEQTGSGDVPQAKRHGELHTDQPPASVGDVSRR